MKFWNEKSCLILHDPPVGNFKVKQEAAKTANQAIKRIIWMQGLIKYLSRRQEK